ncbi:MAG: prolipoprotein diacylglyceryl transferase [Opitutus sp.]|nr:prolipoprotein diacylglyceryl transferase [Opitutus sp.]
MISPLAYWVHDLSPFLIQFNESFGVRYYGLAYLLGFLGGAWLLGRFAAAGRSQLPRERITDFMVALVFGVMIGGRLGWFLLYHPTMLFSDPLSLVRVWEGGMASHGGFLGVAIALWWFSRSNKIPFLHLGDLIVACAPLGLLLGRIANFINGELWGKPSSVAWAVIFSNTGGDDVPRHPSQLYQAALEGALLLALMQWRFWRSDIVKTSPGRLSGEFMIAYAILRAIGEIFREPDASLFFGLSRGTFYSIFLVAAGAVLIALSRRSAKADASTRT